MGLLGTCERKETGAGLGRSLGQNEDVWQACAKGAVGQKKRPLGPLMGQKEPSPVAHEALSGVDFPGGSWLSGSQVLQTIPLP